MPVKANFLNPNGGKIMSLKQAIEVKDDHILINETKLNRYHEIPVKLKNGYKRTIVKSKKDTLLINR